MRCASARSCSPCSVTGSFGAFPSIHTPRHALPCLGSGRPVTPHAAATERTTLRRARRAPRRRGPRARAPSGQCAAPSATVASIERSPHSARKMSVPTWRARAAAHQQALDPASRAPCWPLSPLQATTGSGRDRSPAYKRRSGPCCTLRPPPGSRGVGGQRPARACARSRSSLSGPSAPRPPPHPCGCLPHPPGQDRVRAGRARPPRLPPQAGVDARAAPPRRTARACARSRGRPAPPRPAPPAPPPAHRRPRPRPCWACSTRPARRPPFTLPADRSLCGGPARV